MNVLLVEEGVVRAPRAACLLVCNDGCVGFGSDDCVRWMSCLSNGRDDETMAVLGKTDVSKLGKFGNTEISTPISAVRKESFQFGYVALKTVVPKTVDVFYFDFVVPTGMSEVNLHVEPLSGADTEPVQILEQFEQQFMCKDFAHNLSCNRLQRKKFEVNLHGKSKTPWRLTVLVTTRGLVDAQGIVCHNVTGMHHDVYFE